MSETDYGWIRLGRGGVLRMAAITAGLSAGIAIFIAYFMTELGVVVFGVRLSIAVGWLIGIVVVFVLLAPLMLARASRPVWVDAARSSLRVGRRAIPVSEVHHAYRVPDGVSDARFQLRLALAGALDPVIGVASRPPHELSRSELQALLELVERAPIVPDPAVPLRPPIADELGPRSEAQVVDDEIAELMLPFETMSFDKATLIVELRRVADALPEAVSDEDAAVREIGLVMPGAGEDARRTARIAEASRISNSGRAPGFWGLGGAGHRRRLREVEQSLSLSPAPAGWRWWAGLTIVVFGLVAPWGAVALLFRILGVGGPSAGIVVFLVLTWPFFVWSGAVLLWRARLDWIDRARDAALAIRRAGREVPEQVVAFFGPGFADVRYANGLVWYLITMSLVLLAGGLVTISVTFGQVENWQGDALGVVVGALLVVCSAPVFTVAVRVIAGASTRTLRHVAVWRVLGATEARALPL